MGKKLLVMLASGLLACFSLFLYAGPGTLQQVVQSGQLRVCIWPDYYSISYRDPRTRELSGIDIDLARELASDLGTGLEFIDSSFASLIPDLQQGRCEVAMFAVGIIPERQVHLDFTRPHLFSDVMAITTRSHRGLNHWDDLDQPGRVIAVARGTLHEYLMREHFQHARLDSVQAPRSREQEVLSGRADAFITDFPYTLRMLETTDWARLLKPDAPYHLTYYAWAVKPGDAHWLALLNEFMATIKQDGRLLEAAKKYHLEPALVLE